MASRMSHDQNEKNPRFVFGICVMLDDINVECINNKTRRYLFKVMQVIRRVMTSFYTLSSPKERNCYNM